jgi:hypothetical protein
MWMFELFTLLAAYAFPRKVEGKLANEQLRRRAKQAENLLPAPMNRPSSISSAMSIVRESNEF